MSSITDDLNPNLTLTFGDRTYSIPPPSARTGVQIQKLMSAIDRKERGEDVDLDATMRRIGVDDPDGFDINEKMLGTGLYEQMLDELDINEFGRVTETLYVWASTAKKQLAEDYFADPTPAPEPNRAQRRASAKKAATSK